MSDQEERISETTRLGLEIVKEAEEDRLMTLSVGPQHPGSDISDLPLRSMVIIS